VIFQTREAYINVEVNQLNDFFSAIHDDMELSVLLEEITKYLDAQSNVVYRIGITDNFFGLSYQETQEFLTKLEEIIIKIFQVSSKDLKIRELDYISFRLNSEIEDYNGC
jgi:hypothetical protein